MDYGAAIGMLLTVHRLATSRCSTRGDRRVYRAHCVCMWNKYVGVGEEGRTFSPCSSGSSIYHKARAFDYYRIVFILCTRPLTKELTSLFIPYSCARHQQMVPLDSQRRKLHQHHYRLRVWLTFHQQHSRMSPDKPICSDESQYIHVDYLDISP